ncbi:MAG: aminotransferase class V-fold PLP-dependent enzyme, partial [Actinomyces sp.]
MPLETYLDHAASTPLRPEAREAWTAAVARHHANPTGAHAAARAARRALDEARATLAATLGRQPGEIVFTSGGSESDNLAVRGVAARRPGAVVCGAGEHHAVLDPVGRLGGTSVPLTRRGSVDLDALAATLDALDRVALVSVMAVNNETGAITDVAAVAEVVARHAPGALVHTDAVQAVSWIDVDEATAAADLVSVTAHKIGGPVGVGALVVADGVEL